VVEVKWLNLVGILLLIDIFCVGCSGVKEMPAPPGPLLPPPPGVKYIYPEESSTPSAPTRKPVPAPVSTPTPTPIPRTEEQEYSRIASLSERQAFQQSIKDLRTQGVIINFGKQPPYRGARPQGVQLANNITAVNPTWQQLIDFLKADKTDSQSYIPLSYTCAEFAETLHNAAEKAGIRSAFVGIDFLSDTTGHALNAFFTVDLGWVFIDNTGPGLFDRLKFKPLTLFGPQEKDPFAGWSRDSVAYIKIRSELGFIHISTANSSDYAFYEGWKSRSQAFEAALDQYNTDVQSYNDWVRGRVFYRGTPEAVRMQSWSNELDVRKVALERDELALGPVLKPMGTVQRVDVYF
jgi:hypothetical protein